MRVEVNEPCPLPEDPILAEVAAVLSDAGDWGWVVDQGRRLVYMTDQQRLAHTAGQEMAPVVIGEHLFSPAMLRVCTEWRFGATRPELWRNFLSGIGGLVLADTPGGKEELRAVVDTSLGDVVDDLSPVHLTAASTSQHGVGARDDHIVLGKALRIRDDAGNLRGTAIDFKPAAGMRVLGAMAFERDLGHLDRVRSMARAGRRPASILFADLEGSSALARTLSTGSYFAVSRRIVAATDQCVVDAGGVVGRHVGEGVVAFFPVETFDSESGAARACIAPHAPCVQP